MSSKYTVHQGRFWTFLEYNKERQAQRCEFILWHHVFGETNISRCSDKDQLNIVSKGVEVEPEAMKGEKFYRVQVGAFRKKENAEILMDRQKNGRVWCLYEIWLKEKAPFLGAINYSSKKSMMFLTRIPE